MKTKFNLLTLAFLLIPPLAPMTPSWNGPIKVQVIRVLDGDTIEVLMGKRPVIVRISPIDAPEMSQSCQTENGKVWIGEMAKQQLIRFLPPTIDLEILGTDLYGRTLGRISAAMHLVEAGWAVPYQRAYFATLAEKRKYFSFFYHAYLERRGMWACKKLMNPLFYRKKFKSKLE